MPRGTGCFDTKLCGSTLLFFVFWGKGGWCSLHPACRPLDPVHRPSLPPPSPPLSHAAHAVFLCLMCLALGWAWRPSPALPFVFPPCWLCVPVVVGQFFFTVGGFLRPCAPNCLSPSSTAPSSPFTGPSSGVCLFLTTCCLLPGTVVSLCCACVHRGGQGRGARGPIGELATRQPK